MKKITINVVAGTVMVLDFFLMFFWLVVTRWENLDMTEGRLFVTYWKTILEFSLFFILSAILYERTK